MQHAIYMVGLLLKSNPLWSIDQYNIIKGLQPTRVLTKLRLLGKLSNNCFDDLNLV